MSRELSDSERARLEALDRRVLGKSWLIPSPLHAGHTLKVEERDQVEKHKAYWLVCSCGASTTMGAAHVEAAIGHQWSPYDQADQYMPIPRSAPPRARPVPPAMPELDEEKS